MCEWNEPAYSKSITSSSGSIYYYQGGAVDFPFTFTSVPFVSLSVIAEDATTNNNAWAVPRQVTTSTMGGYYVYRGTSATFNAYVRIVAVGLWK